MTSRPPGLWAAIRLLACKDFRQFSRDKLGLALGILLPIALVAVFGFIMGNTGGSDAMPRVELTVLDLEHSEQSQRLVAALLEMRDVRAVQRDFRRTRLGRDDDFGVRSCFLRHCPLSVSLYRPGQQARTPVAPRPRRRAGR